MTETLKIGVIGDYDINKPSHQATNNALQHSANFLHIELETLWLPTAELEADKQVMHSYDALFCAPGSPYSSAKGAMKAIQFARENHSFLRYLRWLPARCHGICAKCIIDFWVGPSGI